MYKTHSAAQQVASAVFANLAEQTTLGIHWPADAIICVALKYKTWPCGWDKHTYVNFFSSMEDFEEYLKMKHEWALCEDNDFALRMYEWDWGPVRTQQQYDRNESHIPLTVLPHEQHDIISAGDDWKEQASLRELCAAHAAIANGTVKPDAFPLLKMTIVTPPAGSVDLDAYF